MGVDLGSPPAVDVEYLKEVDLARRDLRLAERSMLSAAGMVKLALHDSLTYDAASRTGGANGSIRTERELGHTVNSGLAETSNKLEALHAKYKRITFADLLQLAGVVGVEALSGLSVPFTPGRRDSKVSPPEGRIATLKACKARPGQLVRSISRMGLPKCYAVALSGVLPFGPTWEVANPSESQAWDASFFRELLQAEHFGDVVAMPVDPAILSDPELHLLVELYASEEQRWMDDYIEAFQAMAEVGCNLCLGGRPTHAEPLKQLEEARRKAVDAVEMANRDNYHSYLLGGWGFGLGALATGALLAGAWWRRNQRKKLTMLR